MKAKLTFKLPKEREEYELHLRAPEMDSAIWEFDRFLRDAYKSDINLSLEDICEQWCETFGECLLK